MSYQTKKIFKPQNSSFRVRANGQLKGLIFRAKIYLKYFEKITLEALGKSVTNVTNLSQILQAEGLAKISKIQVGNEKSEKNNNMVIKMVITMERSPNALNKLVNIQ